MLGNRAGRFSRFPLLLKFLDAHDKLSVQGHPSDGQTKYIPKGERGKTEAWVVLEAGPQSLVYAGLKPGTTAVGLQKAISEGSVADHLTKFCPKPDDCILIKGRTVQSMDNIVAFEVQENSDVTYRLYDWEHIETKTGQPRYLQIDKAIACVDFAQGAVGPLLPVVEAFKTVLRERIILCEHFGVWRHRGESPFAVGAEGLPHVLVCIVGNSHMEYNGINYAIGKGDVMLLPAVL